jgi:excisionase family DNA binding protein
MDFKAEVLPTVPEKKTRVRKPNTLAFSDRSFLRPDEYAARLGVCRRVINKWIKGNLIPIVKVGRVVLIDPNRADAALSVLTRKTVPVKEAK